MRFELRCSSRGFFVGDDLLQAFDAVFGEGGDAVLADAVDAQAAVLREHVDREVVQPLLVLAEQSGDVADREDGGDGGHGQAARPTEARAAASSTAAARRACDGMLGDAGEHVGEPGLRVDVVHLRRDDQAVHGGGALAAAIGAGEQPRLPSKGNTAQARSAALFDRQTRPSSRKRVKAGQRLSM